jgi:hypothetical protein
VRFDTRIVAELLEERDGLQRVSLDDGSRAYVLTRLIGAVAAGDRVVVNTTAVDLGLGTGGWHVVHWNLERETFHVPGEGGVLKLRYTSLQTDVGAAEERPVSLPTDLAGRPVVVCQLHSQVAAVAVVLREARPTWRIAYVMTDSAALPLDLSDLMAACVSAEVVNVTVTAGQAFGGQYEAVNLPSALTVAVRAGADAVVVAPGPGVVGTGTRLGASTLELAPALDAVTWLGGEPIACVRYSGVDPRPRHRGVSHHTLTALEAALGSCAVVPLAVGHGETQARQTFEEAGTAGRHRLVEVDVPDVAALLGHHRLDVTTMGRGPEEDAGFFAYAAAAGVVASHVERRPGTVQA